MIPLTKMKKIWGRAILGKKSHFVLDMLLSMFEMPT